MKLLAFCTSNSSLPGKNWSPPHVNLFTKLLVCVAYGFVVSKYEASNNESGHKCNRNISRAKHFQQQCFADRIIIIVRYAALSVANVHTWCATQN